MRKTLFTLFAGIILGITSCGQADPNENVDEGKVEGNLYTSAEIGWTIEIPTGWTIVEKDETEARNEKGKEIIEETIGGEFDASGLKNLIVFQKNKFNIFQSTSEPFKVEYEGEWEQNNHALKELIYTTYESQGIKVDSSVTTIEKIDGLNFLTYILTLYGKKGEIILHQMLFSRLINGFDFSVNLNYNNNRERDELLKAFRNSRFEKM